MAASGGSVFVACYSVTYCSSRVPGLCKNTTCQYQTRGKCRFICMRAWGQVLYALSKWLVGCREALKRRGASAHQYEDPNPTSEEAELPLHHDCHADERKDERSELTRDSRSRGPNDGGLKECYKVRPSSHLACRKLISESLHARQNSCLVSPADSHSIIMQMNSVGHGRGLVEVTLPGRPSEIDGLVLDSNKGPEGLKSRP